MKQKRAAVGFLALFCTACGHSPAEWMLGRYAGHDSLSAFQVCKNYGCSTRVTVSLRADEWNKVRALFTPPPEGAAEERERIRQAIGLLETLVGPKAGTEHDEGGAPLVNFNREGQLDCIDESVNTTTYLRFLAADQLLRWHDVGKPAARGYFLDNIRPHNTATVVERDSGVVYTMDSWFHANGVPPETVLLSAWLDGWDPPQP